MQEVHLKFIQSMRERMWIHYYHQSLYRAKGIQLEREKNERLTPESQFVEKHLPPVENRDNFTRNKGLLGQETLAGSYWSGFY